MFSRSIDFLLRFQLVDVFRNEAIDLIRHESLDAADVAVHPGALNLEKEVHAPVLEGFDVEVRGPFAGHGPTPRSTSLKDSGWGV